MSSGGDVGAQQMAANTMLNELPQQQRSQIEQAVNQYRQTLVTQGCSSDVVQTYVWSYYTQCVQKLYTEHKKNASQSAAHSHSQSQQQISQNSEDNQPSLGLLGGQTQERTTSTGLLGGSLGGSSVGLLGGSLGGSSTGLLGSGLGGSSTGLLGARKQETDNFAQPSSKAAGIRAHEAMMQSSMGTSPASSQTGHDDWGKSQGSGMGLPGNKGYGMGMGGKAGRFGKMGRGSGMSSLGSMGAGMFGGMGCGMGMSAGEGNGGGACSGADGGMNPGMGGKGIRFSIGKMGQGMGQGMTGMGQGMSQNMGQGMTGSMTGSGQDSMPNSGVRFPMFGMRRPPNSGMQLRGDSSTPAQRLQAQQAQHEARIQQHQFGQKGGGAGLPSAFRAGFRPPGMAVRPSAAPCAAGAAGGFGGPNAPKFPAALQRWLQQLFAHQQQSGETPDLQKQTHVYLRHWVQQWVRTGELWQRNWEEATLPSPDEIRKNLPPGSLSGCGPDGQLQGTASGSTAHAGPLPVGRQDAGAGIIRPDSFPARGFSGRDKPNMKASRSRSHRRSRSPARRRRGRSSSSSKSSRSRRRRNRSRSRSKSSGSGSRAWWMKARDDKGKGKGKDILKGKEKGNKKTALMDEQREKVRLWLNEKIDGNNGRPILKELSAEIQQTFNVPPQRFKTLFNQTLSEYVGAYKRGGAEAAWPGGKKEEDDSMFGGQLSQGEQDMRSKRAARFQSHLGEEKKSVAMVNFNDSEAAHLNGGPIVGELNDMCSREEAKEREMTRQLDKFEWKKGTDPRNPEVNLALATRKYQRSSADKAYKSSHVRSLPACWRTVEFLMTEILDFDDNPKPVFAVQSVPYIEVYSYLRDRTRALRVDLHLQQPRSTTQRVFVETHECCLRFEMLSLFILLGSGSQKNGQATEKYDAKLGLKAISQTIEPLLNAYQAIRDKQLAKNILAEAMGDFGLDDGAEDDYCSPWEMSSHRYIVLLLMSFAPEEVSSHLSKISREILSHPLVSFATRVYAAFQTDDYATFLRLYRDADFLSAVAMSGVADLARLRALWLLVRTYPLPIGDKISLARLKNTLAFASDDHAKSFLAFHGLQLVIDKDADGGAYVVMPKKGTPEANQMPLLQGPAKLPDKCEFPKGADSLLVAKFQSLGLSRADIVFGSADPMPPEVVAEPDVCAEAMPEGEEGTLDGQDGMAAPEGQDVPASAGEADGDRANEADET